MEPIYLYILFALFGFLLGILNYAGLWFTLKFREKRKGGAQIILISSFLRTAILVALFVLMVTQFSLYHFAMALIGFLVSRFTLIRMIGKGRE